MTSYYSSSMESVLECMIPSAIRDGMQAKTERTLVLTDKGKSVTESELLRAPKQRALLHYMRKERIRFLCVLP